MKKKVVAFLQNQWFKAPERAKKILRRYEEREEDGRETFIRDMLFFGCPTGKRILAAFGDEMRWKIVWEETSTEIGGKASSAFPPDLAHVGRVLKKHHPDVVLTFGTPAKLAVGKLLQPTFQVINLPHPAARGGDVVARLRQDACELRELLEDDE